MPAPPRAASQTVALEGPQPPAEPALTLWSKKLPSGLGRLALLGGFQGDISGPAYAVLCAMLILILVSLGVGFFIAMGGSKELEDGKTKPLARPMVPGAMNGQAFPVPRPSSSAVGPPGPAAGGEGARLSDAFMPSAYQRPSLTSFGPSSSARGLPQSAAGAGAAVPTPPGLSSRFLGGQRPPQALQERSKGIQLPLCPELVVPQSSECSLLVPSLFDRSKAAPGLAGGGVKGETTLLTVDDSRGTPVFRVALSAPSSSLRSGGGSSSRCLTLSSATGEALFALAREKEAKRSLSLCDHADKVYGEVSTSELWGNGGTFTLSTVQGHRIHFRSDGGLNGSLNATADDGRLLAIVEAPPNTGEIAPRRPVIIGPLVDAGLIVLCLLSIDWLRHESRAAAA